MIQCARETIQPTRFENAKAYVPDRTLEREAARERQWKQPPNVMPKAVALRIRPSVSRTIQYPWNQYSVCSRRLSSSAALLISRTRTWKRRT
jgi:hypothetical protein